MEFKDSFEANTKKPHQDFYLSDDGLNARERRARNDSSPGIVKAKVNWVSSSYSNLHMAGFTSDPEKDRRLSQRQGILVRKTTTARG